MTLLSRAAKWLGVGFTLALLVATASLWLLPPDVLPGGISSVKWRSMLGPERGTLVGAQAETLEAMLRDTELASGSIGDEAPHYVFQFRPRYGPPMTLTSYADGRVRIFRSGIPFGRTFVGTNTRLTAWLNEAVH